MNNNQQLNTDVINQLLDELAVILVDEYLSSYDEQT